MAATTMGEKNICIRNCKPNAYLTHYGCKRKKQKKGEKRKDEMKQI
jgi:hypothetical protein